MRGSGFGLGILGVLSVFRLRSVVIDHHDVAYFFATLSIGIVGGLTAEPEWLTPVFCAALLVALFLVDHPLVSSANERQILLLDRVHKNWPELRTELARWLDARVLRVDVQEVDLLRQTTLLDVRFRSNETSGR